LRVHRLGTESEPGVNPSPREWHLASRRHCSRGRGDKVEQAHTPPDRVRGCCGGDLGARGRGLRGTPWRPPPVRCFDPEHQGGRRRAGVEALDRAPADRPSAGVGGTGGWGGIFKLQQNPKTDTGKLALFYKGNIHVTGLDNASFLSKDKVTFVEDAGDTLHSQRNALDSGCVFDLKTDYSNVSNQPLRWLAERRDPSATIDSSFSFSKNEGDNEITGTTVSDGDPSPNGLLGASIPSLFDDGWRWFYTQQHGDNTTWEVVPSSSNHGEPND
jgi:hypothetical protein